MAYYFLSIGGSGAKVMESLLHLCIAGMLPNRTEELKIFSIDPDTGNGNLDRASAVLKNYEVFQELRDSVGHDTRLFQNKVSVIEPYPWSPTKHDTTLDDMMAYPMYKGKPIGDLYEVLYTKKERATKLDQGFRGHPSIGAAVLAQNYVQLKNKGEWNNLFRSFEGENANVKIFIAGSVFGGTGAAGLPTISRLLKNGDFKGNDKTLIGGAFMLPYFKFTPEGDNAQLFARSEAFTINTKAALKYYAQRDNVFSSMYLLGDSLLTHMPKFSIGARDQVNNAHILELYAALAAIDFFQSDITNDDTTFKYICHDGDKIFKWSDFPNLYDDKENFHHIFTKFTRFVLAYVQFIKPVLSQLIARQIPEYKYPWFIDMLKDMDINPKILTSFDNYVESFVTWLNQIETLSEQSINLMNLKIFNENHTQIKDVSAFETFDEGGTKLDLNEIWCRLTETSSSSNKGFGKFLRLLYDACDGSTSAR